MFISHHDLDIYNHNIYNHKSQIYNREKLKVAFFSIFPRDLDKSDHDISEMNEEDQIEYMTYISAKQAAETSAEVSF